MDERALELAASTIVAVATRARDVIVELCPAHIYGAGGASTDAIHGLREVHLQFSTPSPHLVLSTLPATITGATLILPKQTYRNRVPLPLVLACPVEFRCRTDRDEVLSLKAAGVVAVFINNPRYDDNPFGAGRI